MPLLARDAFQSSFDTCTIAIILLLTPFSLTQGNFMTRPLLLRLFSFVFLPGFLLSATAQLFGALENGEVSVNNKPSATGETVLATDVIDLRVTDFPKGSGSVTGPMDSLSLTAAGSITNEPLQPFTIATALVEYVDNLVVTAEGVPTGTDLIVEVTWQVSGQTQINTPNHVWALSKVLLSAEGLDLDPDPLAPPPPRQEWTREVTSVGSGIPEPFGRVSFQFLVKAGTPQDANIRMRSVAGVQCLLQVFGEAYLATAQADLSVELVGVSNVCTRDGRKLFRWETTAHSALDYGSRDDDPPSDPPLTVGPSDGGSAFVQLSWPTVVGEFYLVQSTTDTETWSTVTEVLGTGNPVEIDLFRDDRVVDYRLVSDYGSGTPGAPLEGPKLRVLSVMEGGSPVVRLAWQTNHRGLYSLNTISDTGTPSPIESASGDGGVVWFDVVPEPPRQLFQVSAVRK